MTSFEPHLPPRALLHSNVRTLHQRLNDDHYEDEYSSVMPTLCGNPDDMGLGADSSANDAAVRAAVRAQADGSGARTFERTFSELTFEPKLPPGASVHTSSTRRVHRRRIVDHASDKDDPFSAMPTLCGNPDELDLGADGNGVRTSEEKPHLPPRALLHSNVRTLHQRLNDDHYEDEYSSVMPTLCGNPDDMGLGADSSANDAAVRAAVRAQADGSGARTFERTFSELTFEPKLPPGASVHTSSTRRVHRRRIVDHASDKDDPFSAMPTLCGNPDELDLGANDSAKVELEKKPLSKADLLVALREEFDKTEFKRDQLLDELAELDCVHQRQSLEERGDHYQSISKVHLDSALSPLSKAVVPDAFKSRHTLNRERKDQLLLDFGKADKMIAKLQASIDAIAPPPANIFDVGHYFSITG